MDLGHAFFALEQLLLVLTQSVESLIMFVYCSPLQDALSSFEAHEWKAKLEESKASVPPPTDEAAVLQAAVPLTDEARGRHLQVHLCGVRFKASAMKERSITITYRLDLNQEVSVNAELEDGDEACALLGSVKTSSTPIWPDGSGEIHVSLERCHDRFRIAEMLTSTPVAMPLLLIASSY